MIGFSFWGRGQTVITANNTVTGNYEINQNETWNYDTAYIVTCNIVISNGATFSIKPVSGINKGISIYFYPDKKIKIIDGSINSAGGNTKRIKLTSSVKITNFMWEGIDFDNSNNSCHSILNYIA